MNLFLKSDKFFSVITSKYLQPILKIILIFITIFCKEAPKHYKNTPNRVVNIAPPSPVFLNIGWFKRVMGFDFKIFAIETLGQQSRHPVV